MEKNNVDIFEMQHNHATEVAKLHIGGIDQGFISSLGPNFVTALYDAICKSEDSFGYVVIKQGKIIGFSSFTSDVDKLYKSVLKKNKFRFTFLLLGKLFSLKVIRKIVETLFYPNRIKKENDDLPKAEFLSMAIAKEARGQGLATKLIKKGFDELNNRGIEKVKILAAEKLIPINKLYEKLGFNLIKKVENHGVVSNIYVAPTNYFSAN